MTLSYAYVCEERRREITQMCTHIHKYKDITNTIKRQFIFQIECIFFEILRTFFIKLHIYFIVDLEETLINIY